MAKTITPILEKRGAYWIAIVNLAGPSFMEKEIELYRNGIAQTIFTARNQVYNFENLAPGIYKCKQRRSDQEWSDFSNEIDLSNSSRDPIITNFEQVVPADFTGTGIVGSTIKCYIVGSNNLSYSSIVQQNGTWSISINVVGNYCFTQTEIDKEESIRTIGYTVNMPDEVLPKSEKPIITTTSGVTVGTAVHGTTTSAGTVFVYRGEYSYGSSIKDITVDSSGAWSWIPGSTDYGDFQFTFLQAGKSESDPTQTFSVQKTQLPTPLLDSYNILVSDSITITNSGYYSGYIIKKGSNIAQEGIDIQVQNLTGVNDKFKFLRAGQYSIIGQKSTFLDSQASAIIEVTQPQAKTYTVIIKNLCGATADRIQIGVGPTLGDVQVWNDIMTTGVYTSGEFVGYPYVTFQTAEVIPSQNLFFIRDKNDILNVSAGVALS